MNNGQFTLLKSDAEIRERISQLAAQISADYANRVTEDDPLLLLCTLRGAVFFAADLVRKLTVPAEIDFLKVHSYQGTRPAGAPVFDLGEKIAVKGRQVLIIEDIVDTGHTMDTVLHTFCSQGAEELRICTMLDKPARREVEFDPDYTGLVIPDEFVIGFGLDYAEKYREPTPMHYTPRYQSKSRAESLLNACLPVETLIEEQAKTLAQNRRTQWTQKKAAAQTAAANPQTRDSVAPVRDPDAAFFGNMRSITPVPETQPTFLNPDAAAERAMLDKMPDESVSELQAELFGADAEQQGAFADPTVNPLPELSEPPQEHEQGQFMQRGF